MKRINQGRVIVVRGMLARAHTPWDMGGPYEAPDAKAKRFKLKKRKKSS